MIAGVTAGLVILLMSVTGVLLTYERQMIAWGDRHYRSVEPAPGAHRLPAGTILEKLTQLQPGAAPTVVAIGSDAGAPVVVTVPPRVLYLDAYSGQLLGEGSQGVRQFMSGLRAWHRWLAVTGEGRPIAKAITGWSNFIFLFIVVSGFYLWFPRKWAWRQVKPVLMFNARLRGKPRDFNWHNAVGAWSAPILFIVVLTAMPISFPWASALIYRIAGEAPPVPSAAARAGAAASPRVESVERTPVSDGFERLNPLWARAERQVTGWKTITLRLPSASDAPFVFAIDKGNGGQPQLRSTLTLDGPSAAVIRYEAFADQTPGRQARSISRFAHTGEILGIAGQTAAGLASAGGAVLVLTGLALACRRLGAWLKRRAGRRVPQAPAIDSASFGTTDLSLGED